MRISDWSSDVCSSDLRFLADRKQVLKKAWAAETSQHGRATLDRHMTLLYNYFAQPPALPGFCRAASAEVIRLSAIPPADFEAHAGQALARLEAPIVDFYRAYHQYRSEEHTSELQSLMRISYAVFCLKKK